MKLKASHIEDSALLLTYIPSTGLSNGTKSFHASHCLSFGRFISVGWGRRDRQMCEHLTDYFK